MRKKREKFIHLFVFAALRIFDIITFHSNLHSYSFIQSLEVKKK